MNRLLLTTFVVSLGVTVAACSGNGLDIDGLPVGAEVAVTKRDGGQLNGTLAERTDAAVRIDVGTTTRTVPRDAITAVKVVEDAEAPPVLNDTRYLEHTIPEGTVLMAALDTLVTSHRTAVGDEITAKVSESFTQDDRIVVPAESLLTGRVISATPSGKVKGRASVSLEFSSLAIPSHEMPYPVDAAIVINADPTRGKDVATVGAPAVGGAVVGGILGGKKGAVIGGIIGAGAGTAAVLTTPGQEVELEPGTLLRLRLKEAVNVRVPVQRRGGLTP